VSPVRGEVEGDECPVCNNCLDLEGEFHEGSEVECECGALLEITDVQAVYTVRMGVLTLPEKEKET